MQIKEHLPFTAEAEWARNTKNLNYVLKCDNLYHPTGRCQRPKSGSGVCRPWECRREVRSRVPAMHWAAHSWPHVREQGCEARIVWPPCLGRWWGVAFAAALEKSLQWSHALLLRGGKTKWEKMKCYLQFCNLKWLPCNVVKVTIQVPKIKVVYGKKYSLHLSKYWQV